MPLCEELLGCYKGLLNIINPDLPTLQYAM
uniref:Uncharacterized protein n=1 Tax=Rhizophora mucronata TaxID=61149 RepID=A0A2P2QRD4_RHIMU